jgi:hypothetical protein
LEIGPAHASDGWLLTVVVEDEAGPRLPDRETRIEGEQQIDVASFYRQFIRPGRGLATVTAEVETAGEAQVKTSARSYRDQPSQPGFLRFFTRTARQLSLPGSNKPAPFKLV